MELSLSALVFIVIIFVIYVIAKVISLNKRSQQDWQRVDRQKLKQWDDEDDW